MPASLVAVKYQRQVDERNARVLLAEGGGVLVTRSLDGNLGDGRVCAISLSESLLLLDASALAPTRH